MNPQPLPETVYKLLETAISASKKLDRKKYLPHHRHFHSPGEDGRCRIGLAGAVMAVTYNHSPEDDVLPSMHPPLIRWKLEALHHMQNGRWVHAYGLVHLVEPCLFTESRLSFLRVPAHTRFIGWRTFNSHLRSIARTIPKLRKIE